MSSLDLTDAGQLSLFHTFAIDMAKILKKNLHIWSERATEIARP